MQIIAAHASTDFDGLASMVAATLIYPDAQPVLHKTVNPNVKAFLSIHKDWLHLRGIDELDLNQVERLIVVDTNDWRRLDRLADLKNKPLREIILWDHHPGCGNIRAHWACQEPMGANITLMVRRLSAERKIITPIQATLFLAGLYEDTGQLSFPATQAEDAHAAGYLLDRKADLRVLSSFLRPAYGRRQKQLLFQMMRDAVRRRINGYWVSFAAASINSHVDGLAIVVHMYSEVVNVDAAFGIFSHAERNKCIVIGRSRIDEVDVGQIMRALGGGGHPGAGSAVVKDMSATTVEQMIADLIADNRQGSVQITDLMSFPVYTASSDTPMGDIAHVLKSKGCTGLPVVDNGRLVGVISRRDFKKIRRDRQLRAPVRAFMHTPVVTIGPHKSPAQASRLLVKHDIGRLPVVQDGRIIGIVTRSDVMRYFYDLLPD